MEQNLVLMLIGAVLASAIIGAFVIVGGVLAGVLGRREQ